MMKRSQGAVILALSLFASILAISQPSFALLCVESCVPEPPPPPEPPPGCSYALGVPTVTVSGTVRNVSGALIAGATVYNWCKITTTTALGSFSLQVPLNDTTGAGWVTAKHDLYRFERQQTGSPASPSMHFQSATSLKYLATPLITPDAFNDLSTPLTFQIYTTAPVGGTRPIFQVPGRTPLVLVHDTTYTSPAGWSRWGVTTAMPAGFALGRQTLHACVLSSSAAAADQCYGPPSVSLISQVQDFAVAYDQTPPAATTSTPVAFSNVTSTPATISVTLADAGGAVLADGIFPSRLDGQSVAASRSGDTISLSGAGLAQGVHLVEIDAADTAGNSVTLRSLFTIVTLTAADATAALREQTVQVNPADGAPPSSVTINPEVDVTAYAVWINATTETGLVGFHRTAHFPAAVITFRRPDGAQVDQSASISGLVEQRVGLVAPSASHLSATLAATSAQLDSIAVPVPAGFGGAGSTATLVATTRVLGPPALDPEDPVVPARPIRLALTIASCIRATIQCSTTGGQTVSGYFPQLGWQNVAAPAGALPPEDDESVYDPGCRTLDTTSDGTPCGQEPRSGTVTAYECPRGFESATKSMRCGLSNLLLASNERSSRNRSSGIALGCGEQLQGIDLCSGSPTQAGHLAALYQTPFAYSQAGCLITQSNTCASDLVDDPATFIVWHQVTASPAATMCPQGLGMGNVASLIRLYTTYGPGLDSNYVLDRIGSTVRVGDTAMPQTNGPYWAGFMEGSLYRIVHAIPASRVPPQQTGYDALLDRSPTLNDDLITAEGTGTSMWPDDLESNVAALGDLEMYSGAEFRPAVGTTGSASVNSTTTAIFDVTGCAS